MSGDSSQKIRFYEQQNERKLYHFAILIVYLEKKSHFRDIANK